MLIKFNRFKTILTTLLFFIVIYFLIACYIFLLRFIDYSQMFKAYRILCSAYVILLGAMQFCS